MSLHDVWMWCVPFFPGKVVRAEAVEETLCRDAPLFVFREFDEQQQLTAGFADQRKQAVERVSLDRTAVRR